MSHTHQLTQPPPSSTETGNNDTEKGKRTNSLAFAQSDCHTCATLQDQCDRRRPRCTTCIDQGRNCDGFATSLSWSTKRMFYANPSSMANEINQNLPGETSTALEPGRSDPIMTEPPGPPLRFRFMGDPSRPKKRRRTTRVGEENQRRPRAQEEVPEPPEVPVPVPEGENQTTSSLSAQQMENDLNELEPSDVPLLNEFDLYDSIIPSIFGSASWLDFDPQEPLSTLPTGLMSLPRTPLSVAERAIEPIPEGESQNGPPGQDFDFLTSGPSHREVLNGTRLTMSSTSPHFPTATVIPNFASNDHDWLFQMYDSEFCVLPLTSDIAINPFRCKPQITQGSRLLFHSVLALCYHHLKRLSCNWSDQMSEHRGKAVQLLEGALRSKQSRGNLRLLEPILILFTLDCTISAIGHWNTHLERAHSMLQTCGGPESLTSPRVRSQVGMLLWWDATLALISRQCPILDRSYLDYLVEREKQDEWSFFDLTGCPRDLLVILYNLAELARQSEIASSMKWLSFDLAPVIDAEQKLTEWENDLDPLIQAQSPDISDVEAEKHLHEWQDRYHCAEAWRCALLLYIESVFKRENQKSSFAITRLVRSTLDHVRCCRRTSQTQKQLLLPIFLAGSETSEGDMRSFVKDYCAYWGEKSRYNMFNSVPELLEEIWTSGSWWGAVVDSKAGPSSSIPDHGQRPKQLLFG